MFSTLIPFHFLGVSGITSPLLGHYDRVKAVLSHKSCTVFPQIEVDHNLIEVDDGWVWNIMEMCFQPVDKEKIGIYICIFPSVSVRVLGMKWNSIVKSGTRTSLNTLYFPLGTHFQWIY